MRQWEGHRARGDKGTLPNLDKVLQSIELVLDDQGELREVNRVAGENEVTTPILSRPFVPTYSSNNLRVCTYMHVS